jgi:hypothetical protein
MGSSPRRAADCEGNLPGYFLREGVNKRFIDIIETGKRQGLFRDGGSRQTAVSFISFNMFYLVMTQIINPVMETKDEEKFLLSRPTAVDDLFPHGLKAE